ncbi:Methyl-accepting chemotaxis protein [hydrothermal vent metagenome]|uniref:Methyl-accepting chemotaxis protein n=1 Tax=hydrothermal vent metagenome TaxID=652676 RepID=A0A1W1EKW9_9ZZZZ
MNYLNKKEVDFKDGIIIIEMNRDGIITYVNSKFREITGYPNSEIIGKHYSTQIDNSMPKSVIIDIWDTLFRKRIWRGYVKSNIKDNRYYWAMVWIQPRFNKDKVVIGYIATFKHAYRSKTEKIDSYLRFLSFIENSNKIPYPYGRELTFGSDFIASKYLDLDLDKRVDSLVDKKIYTKLMKYKIDT